MCKSRPTRPTGDAADSRDSEAANKLLTLVYEDLRKLAAHKVAHEKPGQTLQATALVHEAWLRLSQSTDQKWLSRDQFFRAAAEVMRRILVDNARRKVRIRHGGRLERVELDCVDLPIAKDEDKCLQVDEVLARLNGLYPQKPRSLRCESSRGCRLAKSQRCWVARRGPFSANGISRRHGCHGK